MSGFPTMYYTRFYGRFTFFSKYIRGPRYFRYDTHFQHTSSKLIYRFSWQGYFGHFPQESLSLGGYPAEQINIRFRSELIIRFKIRQRIFFANPILRFIESQNRTILRFLESHHLRFCDSCESYFAIHAILRIAKVAILRFLRIAESHVLRFLRFLESQSRTFCDSCDS